MKRFLCLLLTGLLLLAGCQTPAVMPEDAFTTKVATTATAGETTLITVESTTPTTTVTQPPTTTTTLSEEEEREQIYKQCIDEFLQAWKAGNAEGLTIYTGSKEMAALLAEGVKVESYRLVHATDDKPHRLTLSVSASEVPSVPVGESEWWIRGTDNYDGIFVEFCPIDEDYTVRWSSLSAADGLPVWFCSEMSTELELFDTVKDYSRLSPAELGAKGGLLMRMHNGWLKATEENPMLPDRLTVSELSWFTERVLGVNVTDFSASPTYEPPTETAEATVELESYGGRWHYASLVDHTEQGGTHTVTLCFYADISRLVEAVTVRYTVRHQGDGTFRLLSTQRISGGTYRPAVGRT